MLAESDDCVVSKSAEFECACAASDRPHPRFGFAEELNLVDRSSVMGEPVRPRDGSRKVFVVGVGMTK